MDNTQDFLFVDIRKIQIYQESSPESPQKLSNQRIQNGQISQKSFSKILGIIDNKSQPE